MAASSQPEALFQYNDRGQITLSVDPEGNSTLFAYYPEGHPLAHFLERVTRAFGRPEASSTEFVYDEVGNLIALVDPEGHRTEFRFDLLNQIAEIIAPAPFFYRTVLRYDAKQNLVRIEVDNRTAEGTIDPSHPVIETRFSYNSLENLVARADEVEEGRFLTTQFLRDPNENIVETVLPRGNRIRDTVNEEDLVVARTTGAGTAEASTESFVYDPNGNPEVRTDGNGHATTTLYDGFDRPVEVIDALGNRTLTVYDVNSNVLSTQRFDSVGKLLSRVDQDYDALNRQVRTREFIFDEPGGPVREVAVTEFTYDRSSVLRRIKDPLGRITSFETDGMNRVVVRIDPLGNQIETEFDRNSNPLRIHEIERLPDGAIETFTTRNEFDSLHRLLATIDNIGNRTEFGHDSRNNQTRVRDAEGNVIRNVVDGLSRVVAVVRELRQGGTATQNGGTPGQLIGQIVTQTRYNDNGFPEALVDDKGNTTVREYNARDLRTAEIYPDGTGRTSSYDKETNVLEAVDNNGTRVLSKYNDVDLLVRRDILRAPGVEGGTFENYEYDGLYRMTLAENDFARTALRYDSLSRVFEETQQIRPFPAKTIRRTFDAVGNKTGLTYPSGRVLRMVPDALNRIDRIEELSHPFLAGQNPLVAKYVYAGPARLLVREHGNGTFLAVTYDAVKRPVRWEHRTVDTFREIEGSEFPGLIAGFEYAYDRVHNKRMERFVHDRGQPGDVFLYDSVYRLVDAAYGALDPIAELAAPGTQPFRKSQSWALDGVGNWQTLTECLSEDEDDDELDEEPEELLCRTRTFLTNNLNQYVQINGTFQRFDPNGNLIEKIAPEEDRNRERRARTDRFGRAGERAASEGEEDEPEDEFVQWNFVYDFRNLLVRVLRAELEPGELPEFKVVAEYTHDALGRRITKFLPGDSSDRGEDRSRKGRDHPDNGLGDELGEGHDRFLAFYWDDEQLIEERDDRDEVVRIYTLGSGVDEWIALDSRGHSRRTPAERLFYHANHLGSTAALTDSRADVVERARYEAYGEVRILKPDGRGNRKVSRFGNRFFFTGREFDRETGLYHYRFRHHDPVTGRFLQRDPLSPDDFFNLYSYVQNNPLRFIDPFGLQEQLLPPLERQEPFGPFLPRDEATEVWDRLGSLPPSQMRGLEELLDRVGRGDPQAVKEGRRKLDCLPNKGRLPQGFAPEADLRRLQRVTVVAFAGLNMALPDPSGPLFSKILGPLGRLFSWISRGKGAAAPIAGPPAIKITAEGFAHVLERHVSGGAKTAGKSLFNVGETIPGLVRTAEKVAPVPSGKNFTRVVDAGRIIGTDRNTGLPTSVYTVITDAAGELQTTFPGLLR